jgi:hypothetical protein
MIVLLQQLQPGTVDVVVLLVDVVVDVLEVDVEVDVVEVLELVEVVDVEVLELVDEVVVASVELVEVLVDVEVVVDAIVDVVVVVGVPGQRHVSPHATNAPPGLDPGHVSEPGGSQSSPASTTELPQIGPTIVEVVVDEVLVVEPITVELVELEVLVEVEVVDVEVLVDVVEVDVEVDVLVVVVGTAMNSTLERSVRIVLAAKLPLRVADAPTAMSAFGAQSRPSNVALRDACTSLPPTKKWMSVGEVTPSEPASEPLASMTSFTTRISEGARTRSRFRLPTRRLQNV